jgi:hypothetical protein
MPQACLNLAPDNRADVKESARRALCANSDANGFSHTKGVAIELTQVAPYRVPRG